MILGRVQDDSIDSRHMTKVADALSVASELPFLSPASLESVRSNCIQTGALVQSGKAKEMLDEVTILYSLITTLAYTLINA